MAEPITVEGVQVWNDDYEAVRSQVPEGVTDAQIIEAFKSRGSIHESSGAYHSGSVSNETIAKAVSGIHAEAEKAETKAENKQNMEDLFRLSAEYGRQQVLQAEESATRMIERNIERFPQISGLALETATGAASELNEFMQREYEDALDSLYPEWRTDILGAGADAQRGVIELTDRFRERVLPRAMEAADELSFQALGQVSSMLAGEIPDDVAAQLRRQAAEVSQQIGVRGQAAQYLTARDLGRTSLDLIQAGMAAAPGALNLAPAAYNTFAQTLATPMATGGQLTNLMAPFRAPQVDPGSLYGGQLDLLAGLGGVNATAAFQTGAQVLGNAGSLVQNQLQFGTNRADEAYWNQINYGQGLQAQYLAQQNAQGGSGGVGAAIGTVVGGIGGAMLGGPMGAMAGAGIGGSIGGLF